MGPQGSMHVLIQVVVRPSIGSLFSIFTFVATLASSLSYASILVVGELSKTDMPSMGTLGSILASGLTSAAILGVGWLSPKSMHSKRTVCAMPASGLTSAAILGVARISHGWVTTSGI